MSLLWKELSNGFNFSVSPQGTMMSSNWFFPVQAWGPPATMSKQEQTTSLVKPEVKQRPEVPPRSLVQNSSCSAADTSEPSERKVKDMVNKFTNHESKEQEENVTNGYSELPTCSKKPPAVKPKPGRVSSPPQARAEEAPPPPLPKKRSSFLNKQSRNVEGVEPKVPSTGGRSGTATILSATV